MDTYNIIIVAIDPCRKNKIYFIGFTHFLIDGRMRLGMKAPKWFGNEYQLHQSLYQTHLLLVTHY